MASERKFYRHVYSLEVLSEDELPDDLGLPELHHAITGGDCSGELSEVSRETIDAKTCAQALEAQGSEPGFFQLDAEGNDVESI